MFILTALVQELKPGWWKEMPWCPVMLWSKAFFFLKGTKKRRLSQYTRFVVKKLSVSNINNTNSLWSFCFDLFSCVCFFLTPAVLQRLFSHPSVCRPGGLPRLQVCSIWASGWGDALPVSQSPGEQRHHERRPKGEGTAVEGAKTQTRLRGASLQTGSLKRQKER